METRNGREAALNGQQIPNSVISNQTVSTYQNVDLLFFY